MRLACLCVILVAGCVTTRTTGPLPPPRGGTPAEVPLAPGTEDEAEDLRRAVGTISFAQPEPARAALTQFLARHPNSPNRGLVAAELGRIALAAGDAEGAHTILEQHAAGSDAAPSASCAA